MSGFVSFFRNFALTWDAGVVFFLFLAMFFVGLSMGRRRLVLILHSAYLSVALTKLLPFMENFTAGMQKMQKLEIEIGIFWGVTILLFALFSGAHLSSALQITKAEEGSFFQLLLLAFGTAGFLFSSSLAIFPSVYYNKLSPFIQNLFLNHYAQFWWAVGGIFVLVLIRRKAEKNL